MKNCISFFAGVGALAAVLCALLFSLSFAADSAPCAGGAEGVNCVKELRLGGSEVMTIQKPSFKMKVITSDEDIVDARPLKEDKIYIRGKKLGYCTVTVWDELTKQVTAVIDVTVTLDLTGLKQRLYELYPDEDIQVRGSEKGVVLSGTVSGPEVVEQVLRLTQNFLPKQASSARGGSAGGGAGGGTSGIGITNLLKVGALQQVLLEVKFAEVKRDATKDWQAALGLINQGKELNVGAGAAPLGLTKSGTLPTFGQSGSILLNFAGNSANLFANIDNLTAALEFLETESLSRTLAEPRLVTLSGQEASFLAGGEFPFQTVDALGQTDVEFKDFGVGLRFTPVVHSDGKITLRVFPSVSDIVDFVDSPTTGPQAVFDTRQLESTVQLYDGQTLALAGLLKDNMVNVVNKVPGLGDIPILGALFRSSSYLQQKTDLLVAVTPHIVRPVKEGAISYPGEFMTAPNRLEFYLEGRLEGRRPAGGTSAFGDHSFAMPEMVQGEQGGLEGEFGQQPVVAN